MYSGKYNVIHCGKEFMLGRSGFYSTDHSPQKKTLNNVQPKQVVCRGLK